MLSLVFVVRCLVSDLCENFITHSGESFRVIMSNCVGSTGGADKSLARPGRKQANVSVRMA